VYAPKITTIRANIKERFNAFEYIKVLFIKAHYFKELKGSQIKKLKKLQKIAQEYLGVKTNFSIPCALFFTNNTDGEKTSTNIENK